MALGTLADQITYPCIVETKDRTPEVEAKLMKLLQPSGCAATFCHGYNRIH